MSIRPESAEALIEYYEAVAARTRELLERTTPKDLDRIVDENWNPPVTMGVRLDQHRRRRHPARRPGELRAEASSTADT